MDDVIQFIDNKKDWKIRYISHDRGFTHQGKFPNEVIGVKSIRVSLGDYYIFKNYYFEENVTVFYGFDEKSELIDIWVWKTVDSL